MDHALVSASTIVWLGFAIGAAFGASSQRTGFCTMGAVSDIVAMGDWNRMRMWLLAIAVAILGSQALQFGGMIDLGKSIYTAPRLNWLSIVAGGLCFGIGMTLASGCGTKTLIRIGGGNLKSLVVLLVLAYHGYCAVLLRQFERDANQRSHRWYRWFNEAPVLMLVAVVVLVVVKPF